MKKLAQLTGKELRLLQEVPKGKLIKAIRFINKDKRFLPQDEDDILLEILKFRRQNSVA